jgi:predicted NUDIX family NTP pyrophosphohydrolase
MAKLSAGLLMYRKQGSRLEVFLVHPGGPLWKKKDLGAWSLPKGEYVKGEDPLAAALREFEEETSLAPQSALLVPLGDIRQPSGKIVTAWALEGDCDPASLKSNLFSMEWPPKSGKTHEFPEIDRGAWFGLDEAKQRILKGQAGFLDRLADTVVRANSCQ